MANSTRSRFGFICIKKLSREQAIETLEGPIAEYLKTLDTDEKYLTKVIQDFSPFTFDEDEEYPFIPFGRKNLDDEDFVVADIEYFTNDETKDERDGQLRSFLQEIQPITIFGFITMKGESPTGTDRALYYDVDLEEWLPCDPEPVTFACNAPLCYEKACAYYCDGHCRASRVREDLQPKIVDLRGRVVSCDCKILKPSDK